MVQAQDAVNRIRSLAELKTRLSWDGHSVSRWGLLPAVQAWHWRRCSAAPTMPCIATKAEVPPACDAICAKVTQSAFSLLRRTPSTPRYDPDKHQIESSAQQPIFRSRCKWPTPQGTAQVLGRLHQNSGAHRTPQWFLVCRNITQYNVAGPRLAFRLQPCTPSNTSPIMPRISNVVSGGRNRSAKGGTLCATTIPTSASSWTAPGRWNRSATTPSVASMRS